MRQSIANSPLVVCYEKNGNQCWITLPTNISGQGTPIFMKASQADFRESAGSNQVPQLT